MLDNWTWGLSLIALTIAIHVTGVTFLVSVLHSFRVRLQSRNLGLPRMIAIVIAAFTAMGLLLAVLHGIEAAFWAAAYLWVGALDSPAAAILYSVDSMATRGASGLVLLPHRQNDGRAGGSRRHATVRYQHCVHFHGDAVLLPTPCASAPGPFRQSQISPDRSSESPIAKFNYLGSKLFSKRLNIYRNYMTATFSCTMVIRYFETVILCPSSGRYVNIAALRLLIRCHPPRISCSLVRIGRNKVARIACSSGPIPTIAITRFML